MFFGLGFNAVQAKLHRVIAWSGALGYSKNCGRSWPLLSVPAGLLAAYGQSATFRSDRARLWPTYVTFMALGGNRHCHIT